MKELVQSLGIPQFPKTCKNVITRNDRGMSCDMSRDDHVNITSKHPSKSRRRTRWSRPPAVAHYISEDINSKLDIDPSRLPKIRISQLKIWKMIPLEVKGNWVPWGTMIADTWILGDGDLEGDTTKLVIVCVGDSINLQTSYICVLAWARKIKCSSKMIRYEKSRWSTVQ